MAVPSHVARSCLLVGLALATACADAPAPLQPEGSEPLAPSFSVDGGDAAARDARPVERVVDAVNAVLAAGESDLRLTEVWMFTVGRGTDPFRRLRTGPRWSGSPVAYILDESDYTGDLAASAVDDELVAAYDRWSEVPNSSLTALRLPDPGLNVDVLDGIIRNEAGECVDILDLDADNLDLGAGLIFPAAHIMVGGWLSAEYFEDCLGSADILGVTFTFSRPDTDGDQYPDRLYVEQFYNEAFDWVTSGSEFLDPTGGVDLATIATHENGHTHGLGHFGGPNHLGEENQQPFFLRPDGKVFTPEAVMNPFYLFGEKRDLLPTDIAAFESLYAR